MALDNCNLETIRAPDPWLTCGDMQRRDGGRGCIIAARSKTDAEGQGTGAAIPQI